MMRYLTALITCLLLVSCGGIRADQDKLAAMLGASGFQSRTVQAGGFLLREAIRDGAPDTPLWIVIAGDGRAYLDAYTPAPDPTPYPDEMPSIHIAGEIAALFPQDTVFHLTRPCQFLQSGTYGNCPQRFWTRDRYSAEVTNAYEQIIAAHPNRPVVLVGWSGGGVIAAHLAAKRQTAGQPVGLMTMASPIDLDAWTSHHHVSPLPASDNPARFLPFRLPHILAFGKNDMIVPAHLARPLNGNILITPFTHHDDWEDVITSAAPTIRAQIIGAAP